jgi:hypothetical protein
MGTAGEEEEVMKLCTVLLVAALALVAGCSRGRSSRSSSSSKPAEAATAEEGVPAPKVTVAGADDPVLVAGKPPLTESLLENTRALREWLLGIELTKQQRGVWRQRFLEDVKKLPDAERSTRITGYQGDARLLQELAKQSGPERGREQASRQPAYLEILRKSPYQCDKMLLGLYEEAYKPGGTKNPIVVAGEPPLTQQMMDQRFRFVQYLLRLRLTERQRREYQELFVKEWQRSDKAKKEGLVKSFAMWQPLPTWNDYTRNQLRALNLPLFLAGWSKKGADEDDRWLARLHESAHKVGGPCNAVLVKGEPALTQGMVSSYGDYLEWAIDLSISGGLSASQRDVLKEYLVKDWQTMGRDERKGFQATLEKWAEATQASPAKRKELHGALQPKLMAELRTSRNARNVWLLEIHDKDRAEFKRRMAVQQQLHETRMRMIDAMAPSGRYEYNPATRRYDRWVPYR